MKEIAAIIATVANQFGPDSELYDDAVEKSRREVSAASTRDDLERFIDRLESVVTPHLTDDRMDQFRSALNELRGTQEAWPVDPFKEGFLVGSGQELPNDGQAAGRKLNPNKVDR